MDLVAARDPLMLDPIGIAQYRHDGYVLIRGLLGPAQVEACKQALHDLATGRIPPRNTKLMFETGIDVARLAPEASEFAIRKYMDFCDDAPALRDAAFSQRLHLILDQLLGQGRVLFQQMAMVKPPRLGSEKPWHQDASYFRITDPSLVAGVWIALDEALRANGCMELVPGSHLGGGVPHVHENDFNLCRIVPGSVDADARIAVEMAPGDALIFHSLIHHYTAPNRSNMRRRALQYHFHQIGAIWGSLEDHRRHFRDEDGRYAGCTVVRPELPPGN
jgi:phytanoyl-CoA hydroxylase